MLTIKNKSEKMTEASASVDLCGQNTTNVTEMNSCSQRKIRRQRTKFQRCRGKSFVSS